jgi:hypothetical protein
LHRTNLHRIAEHDCYVRVSLNASTDKTRRAFHGNAISLSSILASVERLLNCLSINRSEVPVGATFLLAPTNYAEAADCARLARRVGIRHFSVRRILGPPWLRPYFNKEAERHLMDLVAEIGEMHSNDFRVAVPFRPINQDDLDPRAGDFTAGRCWQSTFKTVLEPDPATRGARVQLCGRYRGGGGAQRLALPALFVLRPNEEWLYRW